SGSDGALGGGVAYGSLFNVDGHGQPGDGCGGRVGGPHVAVEGVVDLLGSPNDSPGVPRGQVGRNEVLDLVIGDRPMYCRGGFERSAPGLVEVDLRRPRIILGPQSFHLVRSRSSL